MCGPVALNASAVAIVDDAVIAIIIAALAACGFTFVTTGGFENSIQYVRELFEDYCSDNSMTSEYALRGIDYGRNGSGKLLLNNRFIVVISTFLTWLRTRFNNPSASQTITIQAGGSIAYGGGYSFEVGGAPVIVYYNNAGASVHIEYEWEGGNTVMNNHVYFVYLRRNPGSSTPERAVYAISDISLSNITISWHNYSFNSTGTQGFNSVAYDSGWYLSALRDWKYDGYPGAIRESNLPYNDTQGESQLKAMLNSTGFRVGLQDGIGIKIGSTGISVPTADPDYSNSNGAILDVGAPWGATLDQILNQTIPGAFSDSEVGSAQLVFEEEEIIEDQVEESQQQTVSGEATDYQSLGLVDVFPFCIPFDLYNFCAVLAADPVAPSFTWRFYVPGICDEDIYIDLSVFNTAAQLLRTMELLLFCVGLAFVTRKIIRG